MFNFYMNWALEIKYVWTVMIMFQPKSVKTIVFLNPNDASGILSASSKFLESESSRAAPTLGSARAVGHDDYS